MTDETNPGSEQQEPPRRDIHTISTPSVHEGGEPTPKDADAGNHLDDDTLTDDERAEKQAREKEEKRAKRKERNNRRATAHIQKLESQLAQEREEKAYFRGLAEAKKQGADDDHPADENPRPMRDDYESEEDYLDARDDWKEKRAKAEQVKQADDKPKNADKQDGDNESPEGQLPTDADTFRAHVERGQEKYGDDWEDMLEAADNNEFAVTFRMAQEIYESDVSEDLTMYLFENPEESVRIAKLAPGKQAREIYKLESQFKEGDTPTPKTNRDDDETGRPAKKVSQTPEPESRNKSTTSQRREKPLNALKTSQEETAEYIARRRKQRAARR